MLAPTSGWDVEHTTFVDRVVLAGLRGPEDLAAGPMPPMEFDFPERIERPEPAPGDRVLRVEAPQSIQAALDAAGPGDVIALAPGVYHERLRIARSGTAEAPIVLRAEEPGTVTITGEPAGLALAFEPVAGDLYRAPVPWHVRWAMAAERNLMGYDDLDGLRAFTVIGHDSHAPEHGPPEGFVWQDGFLYVRLLGGAGPREADVHIHGPYQEAEAALPATAYWGAPFQDRESGGELIMVEGSHIAISGLRLRMAPEVAVRVTGDNVAVRDCLIEGAFRGIRAGEAANLTVERCEFDCYPVYQWVRWGQSEYPERRNSLWNAVYNSNLCATFLEHSGPGAVVRRNLVYECFDGIQRHCHDRERPVTRALASEFSYNAVMSCGDECIEFDSTGPQNLRVHNNFFMDALALLALSPVQGGALTIDHNIIYASPDYGLMPCTMLKFDCPWRTAWIDTPTHDCRVVHNTFVNGRSYLYWTGEDHTFVNNIFENNILWVRLSFPWKIEQLRPGPHNLYAGPNVDPAHMPGVIVANEAGFVSEPADLSLQAPRLPVVPMTGLVEAAPGAARADTQIDFRLAPGSPALDAGVAGKGGIYHHRAAGAAPDLGALELGQDWQFPRPGPSWSVGDRLPWRPPLPPSLDPRWVGLAG
jgi:hypothetical protein